MTTPTEHEAMDIAIMEHLGVAALTGGTMSVLQAFELGWQARASMASPQLTEACRHRATRINALEALERIRDIAEGELSTKPATVEPVSMAAPVVVWEYLQSLSVQLDAALNLTTGNDAHLRVTVSDVADQLAALALTTPQQPADPYGY